MKQSTSRIRSLLLLLAALAVGGAGGGGSARQAPTLDAPWPISARVNSTIVTYPSDEANPVTVRARFNVPKAAAGKVPAVVYVHGTAGVDGRGAFNAFALNEAGIATLEIDMWGARGLAPGPGSRAKLQPTLPFAFGALKFLAGQAAIDAGRIGIEGESMGGGITLRTASRRFVQHFTGGKLRFAGHLAFYPNCTEFVTRETLPPMSGAPVHILLGDHDQDTDAGDCAELAKAIGAGMTVYPGATHQWDAQQTGSFSFTDPLANRGLGGLVTVVPSPATAATSRAFGVEFFRRAFGMAN